MPEKHKMYDKQYCYLLLMTSCQWQPIISCLQDSYSSWW